MTPVAGNIKSTSYVKTRLIFIILYIRKGIEKSLFCSYCKGNQVSTCASGSYDIGFERYYKYVASGVSFD